MANVYSPQSLGIQPPSGGFQQGGWYNGRQYWNGTLSDPGVIHPSSNQQGAGEAVSAEVNAQSAAAQGVSTTQFNTYLAEQKALQAKNNVAPSGVIGTPGGIPAGDGASGAGLGLQTPQGFDIQGLYDNLYKEQGISDIEASLKKKADAFQEAQSKINDNPFLSEAERTGRAQKLSIDYEQAVKNEQDSLVMKKQDIATRLDIATKQFDINSQAAKQALDQFNVLLQSGALAGASGTDIAKITATTGISSSMIQSAINTQKQRDIQTSVTTVDDGANVYSVVVNSQTGEIINKQVISASKPTSGGGASQAELKTAYSEELKKDARAGASIQQVFSLYSGYLDPDLIYQLYNASAKKPYTGSLESLAPYGVSQGKTLSPTDQYFQGLLNGGQ